MSDTATQRADLEYRVVCLTCKEETSGTLPGAGGTDDRWDLRAAYALIDQWKLDHTDARHRDRDKQTHHYRWKEEVRQTWPTR